MPRDAWWTRLLAFVVMAVAALAGAGAYYEARMAGFPDGHRTAWDLAADPSYRAFTWVSAALLVLCLAHVIRGAKLVRADVVLAATIFYGLAAVAIFYGYLHVYLLQHLQLDSGQGG